MARDLAAHAALDDPDGVASMRDAARVPAVGGFGLSLGPGLFPGRGDRRYRHNPEQGTHVGIG
jgi:hypothetical protein